MTAEPLEDRLERNFGPSTDDMPLRHSVPRFLEYDLRMHSVWLLSAERFGRRFVLSNHFKDGGRPRRKTYSRIEMDGLNFSRAKLVNMTFSWTNLRLASFAGAELKDVVFEGCDLEGTDFSGAFFDNVAFKDCLDLGKAVFDRVTYIPTEPYHQNNGPSLP